MQRRDFLATATGAASLAGAPLNASVAAGQGDGVPELHEYVRKMSSLRKEERGAVFQCTTTEGKSVEVSLTVCTPQILRIRMCPDPKLRDIKGLLPVNENWPPAAFELKDDDGAVRLETSALRVECRRDPWQYVIYNHEGEIVLREHVRDIEVTGNCRSLPLGFTTRGGQFVRSNETFYLTPGEGFFGFGETFTKLNKTGLAVDGWHTDAWGAGTDEVYKTIPFFMSTRGYGIFVNTTFRTRSDMGSRSLMAYTVMIDDPRLDLFFIYGPSLKDVLARYQQITGPAAFPPKESFGIWHTPPWSRERTVENLVATAKKFRELDIPIDHFSLIIRLPVGRGQTNEKQLAWTREISRELARFGIKTGMYTAPMLNMGSEMEQEARARGYAVTQADGSPYGTLLVNKRTVDFGKREDRSLAALERSDAWREGVYRETRDACLIPDFTNPEAVRWWKAKIAEHIKAGCYAVEMSDFAEDIPVDAHYHNRRSGLEMHNLYSLLYQKATFEAVAESSGHRGLVCARSGTAGMQRYPTCWPGDPNCEWESMATTMRAGLAIGLSGVPFWSCDNAGFDDEHGHLSPELWIRWSQWSMFLSHVRLHGMGPARVPWSFGDRAVENFRKYAKLRYRLLPYIYSHAYAAAQTGLPLIRAMALDFQDDPVTHHIEDQYMFGDAFLVAPVYSPDNKRTVYLPAGTWYDYDTGREHAGPTTLHIEPALEQLPLYVRADSIIPMGPEMSYVGERSFDPITLDIRLASEAKFDLYDDDERARTREIVQYRARKQAGGVVLNLTASAKTFIARFNGAACPARVTLNGAAVPRTASLAELGSAPAGWYFDPSSVVHAKFRAPANNNELLLLKA